MSPDIARHLNRQRDEWTDADRFDAWLDERERQMDLAGECARDEWAERELERAE